MKNEARLKANVLKKKIDELKDFLSKIENVGVSLSSDGRWLSGVMPAASVKVIRTIVEAELNDQLKKLEEEMEAL